MCETTIDSTKPKNTPTTSERSIHNAYEIEAIAGSDDVTISKKDENLNALAVSTETTIIDKSSTIKDVFEVWAESLKSFKLTYQGSTAPFWIKV